MPRFAVVAVQSPDEPGYSGWAVDLPGVVTQGETLEEFESNMREAIQLFLEFAEEENINISELAERQRACIPASDEQRCLEIAV